MWWSDSKDAFCNCYIDCADKPDELKDWYPWCSIIDMETGEHKEVCLQDILDEPIYARFKLISNFNKSCIYDVVFVVTDLEYEIGESLEYDGEVQGVLGKLGRREDDLREKLGDLIAIGDEPKGGLSSVLLHASYFPYMQRYGKLDTFYFLQEVSFPIKADTYSSFIDNWVTILNYISNINSDTLISNTVLFSYDMKYLYLTCGVETNRMDGSMKFSLLRFKVLDSNVFTKLILARGVNVRDLRGL